MSRSAASQPSLAGLTIIPLALLIHNAEEALTIAGALPRASRTATQIFGRLFELPSPTHYYVALVFLTALGFALYGWAVIGRTGCTDR